MSTLKTGLIVAAAVALLAAGCATGTGKVADVPDGNRAAAAPTIESVSELEAFLADKPLELQELYTALFLGGVENAVANQMGIGLAAMELGYYDWAEAAFLGALFRLDRMHHKHVAETRAAPDRMPASAHSQRTRFEGAIVNLQRGLSGLRARDYSSARNAFLAGARAYQEHPRVMNANLLSSAEQLPASGPAGSVRVSY